MYDDSVTSRRSHHIRSVERPHYKRTSTRSLRHPLDERKNELGERNISVVREDVFKKTGLVLLSFKLEDLTLRFRKIRNKRKS